MEPADLISAHEIAELLGVYPSATSNWRKRPSVGFPEPWGTWSHGSLWLRADVESWHADRMASQTAARERAIKRHERALAKLRAKQI